MQLEIKAGRVDVAIQAIGKKVHPAIVRGVLKGANLAGTAIAEKVHERFSGKGVLARSFLPAKLLAEGPEPAAGALSALPYAGIQNEGGTIVPRTVGALAIPLTSKARNRWPRDWAEGSLVRITSKKGNVLLVEAKGKNIVPQYVLKKSVRIQGRGYIDEAADESTADVDAAIVRELDDAFLKGTL